MGVLAWARRSMDNAVQVLGGFQLSDLLPSRNYPAVTRDLMAQVRRYADDMGGALTTTGSLNAYVVATGSGVTELRPGIKLLIRADRANTGEATINVDGLGPLPWVDAGGARLAAGQVAAGRFYEIVLDAVAPAWRIQAGASTLDEIPGLIGLRTEVATNATDARAAATSTAQDRTATAADRATASTQAGIAVTSRTAAEAARDVATGARDAAQTARTGAETANAAAQDASGTATALVAEVVANQGARLNFQTVTDAVNATIPAAIKLLYIGGSKIQGLGPALYRPALTQAAGAGKFRSADGRFWELTSLDDLSLEMLGAGTGSTVNDAAAVKAANSLTTVARVDTALDVTGQPVTDAFNLALRGRGSVKGAYRKVITPDLAPPAFSFAADDLDPALHMRRFHEADNPVIPLAGDSLTTDAANNVGHINMLPLALQTQFAQAAAKTGRQITFVRRGLGGRGWYNLDPANPLGILDNNRDPSWLTPSQLVWLDYIKALSPDTFPIALGMNPSPNGDLQPFRNALAYIATWTKVPDIIVITNAFPRPTTSGGGGFASSDEAEKRIAMAGVIRSAIRSGLLPLPVGMIDIARAQHRVQLGFDPIIGALGGDDRPAAVTPGTFVGTRPVYDGFAMKLRFDATQLVAGSGDGFSIKTGSGADDVVQILRATTGPNDYLAFAFAGAGLGDAPWQYATAKFTRPPGPDGATWLSFEKHNGRFHIYADSYEYPTDAGAYSLPQLAVIPCVAHGGSFTPQVKPLTPKAAVSFVIFNYMDPLPCQATAGADLLYSNNNVIQPVYYGGSDYNHYGNWFYAHVIAPTLASTRFFSGSAVQARSVTNSALLSAYLYN